MISSIFRIHVRNRSVFKMLWIDVWRITLISDASRMGWLSTQNVEQVTIISGVASAIRIAPLVSEMMEPIAQSHPPMEEELDTHGSLVINHSTMMALKEGARRTTDREDANRMDLSITLNVLKTSIMLDVVSVHRIAHPVWPILGFLVRKEATEEELAIHSSSVIVRIWDIFSRS